MEMIIGGAYQGKTEYAKKEYREKHLCSVDCCDAEIADERFHIPAMMRKKGDIIVDFIIFPATWNVCMTV